jgi:hypothetical protein
MPSKSKGSHIYWGTTRGTITASNTTPLNPIIPAPSSIPPATECALTEPPPSSVDLQSLALDVLSTFLSFHWWFHCWPSVAISFGLTCKHLKLQCMSISVHLWCHPTISTSPTLRTCLEIITLVLPMSSPVPLNPTGAYLVVTHCWLSWQCYYMYSHRLQYLMACYIPSDLKFWYLLSPIYSGFPCS